MYKILHIESSKFFRKSLSFDLSAKGFHYLGAENIEEANEILEKEGQIDIILTAVEFSDGTVSSFIKSLKNQKHRHIPIFVVSGTVSTAKRHDIFELGIVDYILKNTPIPEIVNKIEYFCKNKELIQELKEVKIAVLDDSRFDRMRVSEIFEDSEIKNVDFFESAESLYNSNLDYDIYIVDMVLEESSGEEVIEKIRKKEEYVPILAVSAIENAKIISQVLLKGANDYIIKPYNKSVFLARLEISLRNYKTIKKLINKIEILENTNE
jgi:DNA-binding response OmpR family regulator